MRIAIVMDPLENLDNRTDTSLALAANALDRGWSVSHILPDTLGWVGDGSTKHGDVGAFGCAIERLSDGRFSLHPTQDIPSVGRAFDVVLIRQDPPVDMAYLTTTHLLEIASAEEKLAVVNSPLAIRNMPEKISVLSNADMMPATIVTRSLKRIKDFRSQHKDVVIKPLYGNGGDGVFVLREKDPNFSVVVELMQRDKTPFIVQEFLPHIVEGDKRVILIGGVVIGAINRKPPAGEYRSNMHAGGAAEACDLTPRQHYISQYVASLLKEQGVFFAGIDLIGDSLTEINITSPTGIVQLSEFVKTNIAGVFWDMLPEFIAYRGNIVSA